MHLPSDLREGFIANPGYAARLSLLSLLQSWLLEAKIERVLEVGSGLTTRCIAPLISKEGLLVSIDESMGWQEQVRSSMPQDDAGKVVWVSSPGLCKINFRQLKSMGLAAPDYDLVVIDGPSGDERFSADAMDFFLACSKNAKMIVIDDTDRVDNKKASEHIACQIGMNFRHVHDDLSIAHLYTIIDK